MADLAHLPGDVVLEIAHVFVQTGTLTWLQSHDRCHTLAAICKGWCATVRDNAALWKHVTIHLAMSANFVKLCLEGSKEVDITVVLSLHRWNHSDHTGLVHPLPSVHTRDTPKFVGGSVSLPKTPFTRVVELTMNAADISDLHILATAVERFKAPKPLCVRYTCLSVPRGLQNVPFLPKLPSSPPLKKLCIDVISPMWHADIYGGLTCLHLTRSEGQGLWHQLCLVLSAARALMVLALVEFRCVVPVSKNSKNGSVVRVWGVRVKQKVTIWVPERRDSGMTEIWSRRGNCSLATYSRWSTQVTGRVDRGGSGVGKVIFGHVTYGESREERATCGPTHPSTPAGATVLMSKLDSFQLTYSQDQHPQIARAIDAPNIRRVRFEACGMASLAVLRAGGRIFDLAVSVDLFAVDNVIGDLICILPSLKMTVELDVRRCGPGAKDAILCLATGAGSPLGWSRKLKTLAYWSARDAWILLQMLPDGCRLSGICESGDEHKHIDWMDTSAGLSSNEFWYNYGMYSMFGDDQAIQVLTRRTPGPIRTSLCRCFTLPQNLKPKPAEARRKCEDHHGPLWPVV
ncbi:hypothetical protein DFH06DRAFT_1130517 [Mycena polygramma]|nr:hypothetical protein DFH06DRAFT_1130517 [Mycena polygramma]